jgi:hypothetical protein
LRHIEVAFEQAAFFFEYVAPAARRDAKIECRVDFQDAGAPGGEIEVEAGILRRPWPALSFGRFGSESAVMTAVPFAWRPRLIRQVHHA